MRKYTTKIIAGVIVLIFAYLSLSFILPNGETRCQDGVCGYAIGQWHLHDYLWHLAIVKTSFPSLPLQHPNYSGAELTNYNALLDAGVYGLTRLGIPADFVFFKLLPLLFVPLFIWQLHALLKRVYRDRSHYLAALFFLLLGTSFSYLIPLYKAGNLYYATLIGFPIVTSIQTSTIFLNLQYAYSLLFLVITIRLLISEEYRLKTLHLALLVILNMGLKFYGGIVTILMIAAYYGWQRQLRNLIIPITAFIAVALFLYNPFEANGRTGFAFDPLALVHYMIEDPHLFYSHYWTLARYTLLESGLSPRLIAIELVSVALFLAVNFGTRLIGISNIVSKIWHRRLTTLDFSVLTTICVTTIIPILFIQKGSFYNTMQFLYYGIFLSGFFAADTLVTLLSVKKIGYVLGAVIIALTLPTHFDQLRYSTEKQAIIPQAEVEMLQYLESLPPGDVFVTSTTSIKNAYISALSGKPTYLTDDDQLQVTGVDYQDRWAQLTASNLSIDVVTAKYWYLRKKDSDFAKLHAQLQNKPGFRQLQENDDIILYEKYEN